VQAGDQLDTVCGPFSEARAGAVAKAMGAELEARSKPGVMGVKVVEAKGREAELLAKLARDGAAAAKKTPATRKPKKTATKKTATKKTAAKKTAAEKSPAKQAASSQAAKAPRIATFRAGEHQLQIQHPAGVKAKRIETVLKRHPPGTTRLETVTRALAKLGASFVPFESGSPGDSGAYNTAKKTAGKKTAAKKTAASATNPGPKSGPRPSQRGAHPGTPTDAQMLAAATARFPAHDLASFELLWPAGAKQATHAWMTSKGVPAPWTPEIVLDWFMDWVRNNLGLAQAMVAPAA
jgi:hypothetical protein